METLATLESSALSNWLRESGPAFFTALTVHAVAMAFVVGINIFISLRLTGFASSIPLQPLQKFYPLHWICVVLIVLSGLALLIAYPAKALTNPVFYVKLMALTIGLMLSRHFQLLIARNILSSNKTKTIASLAVFTLILWIITITAGRFLAYTHTVLLASRFY